MRTDEASALSASETADTITATAQPLPESSGIGRLAPQLTRLFFWGTKGTLALTDQASFAGAQFALNILLARWLLPSEYGAFAVAYSVFLLASAAHSALLIEPMIVFGSGRYLKSKRSYLGLVLRGHWLLTVPAGIVLLGTGLLVSRLYSPPVGHALCALGIALPLILLAWLTRRAFYIELQPGRAAVGGAIFFVALVTFAYGLHMTGALTPAVAILAMGAAASLAAAMHLLWLRPQWSHESEELRPKEVASKHWGYGRWVLAAVLPSWILTNVYYLGLPVWYGLKSAGAFKAMMNLAMPATHSLVAAGSLVLPLVVQHRDIGGLPLIRRTIRWVTSVFVGAAAVYLVFLWFFRVPIVHLLYAGKYVDYSDFPVFLVGLVPLVTACSVTFGAALSALERPDRVFWANVAASTIALSLGLLLAAIWGIPGAIGGYLASYATLASMFWFFYRGFYPIARLNPN